MYSCLAATVVVVQQPKDRVHVYTKTRPTTIKLHSGTISIKRGDVIKHRLLAGSHCLTINGTLDIVVTARTLEQLGVDDAISRDCSGRV